MSLQAYSKRLNLMENSEWLRFTKTWFIHKSSRKISKDIHPASFPDELAEEFINFFTRPGDCVLDPFAGVGSTMVAAKKLNRDSMGIELYNDYIEYAEKRISEKPGSSVNIIHQGDSRVVLDDLQDSCANRIDFCITSPPYWCQLSQNSERQDIRKTQGLKTDYGDSDKDIGKITDYDEFIEEQGKIFSKVDKLMKKRAYIVVITNNCYKNGRLYPLAFDTFNTLSKIWTPKDEKIWCQDDKKLFPFGMFSSYVGNRSHHYCLIFRKE